MDIVRRINVFFKKKVEADKREVRSFAIVLNIDGEHVLDNNMDEFNKLLGLDSPSFLFGDTIQISFRINFSFEPMVDHKGNKIYPPEVLAQAQKALEFFKAQEC